jgi:uncharacterized membrane protein
MLSGQLALVAATAFAAVAIYVSACEHPARLMLDDRALLVQWKPAYRRGTMMQAPLSLIGTILGGIEWWQSSNWLWLAGAASLLLPFPFTVFVIKPINDALIATDPEAAGERGRAMLVKWGHLHAVRTALGILATILYLAASLARSTS